MDYGKWVYVKQGSPVHTYRNRYIRQKLFPTQKYMYWLMIIDFSIVCIIYVDNFTFLVWPIAPTSGETSCTITLNSDFDNLLDIYQCIQSFFCMKKFSNIREECLWWIDMWYTNIKLYFYFFRIPNNWGFWRNPTFGPIWRGTLEICIYGRGKWRYWNVKISWN